MFLPFLKKHLYMTRRYVLQSLWEVMRMTKYTTGEMAKLCGVSVRTVQYYDSRSILVPSELSEGGRRLYTDDDLRKLKIICFLRDLDLPIESIKKLLAEEHPEHVISLLLDEQEKGLRGEIESLEQKADKLAQLRKNLKRVENFSADSIADIAYVVENKRSLRRLRIGMLALGAVMDVIEIAALVLLLTKGIWWPAVVGLPIVVALGILISKIYYQNVAYICPECHKIFKPRLGEMFWAYHTPNTRRLHCPNCAHHGFCVEVFQGGGDA